MADFDSLMIHTANGADSRSLAEAQIDIIDVQEVEIAKQQPKHMFKGYWAGIARWKRAAIITLIVIIVLLVILLALLYGVIYVLIRDSFNADSNIPQYEISDVGNNSVRTVIIQQHPLASSLPLQLSDFNLSYSTANGEFATMMMPGYLITNRYLNLTYDSALIIKNETQLGEFGNQLLTLLTSNSTKLIPYELSLSSDMPVALAVPGLTFVSWTIPYRRTMPFELTGLANIQALLASMKLQQAKAGPAPAAATLPPPPSDASQLQSRSAVNSTAPPPANATQVKTKFIVKHFWLQTNIQFTNPLPAGVQLDLVKAQIYSFDNHIAEAFVSNFTLVRGRNDIKLVTWVNHWGHLTGLLWHTLLKGYDVHQFSVRNVTFYGNSGYVGWINKWFEGIELSLPHKFINPNATVPDSLYE